MRADQHPLAVWLRALWPVPLAAGRRELWLGGLGVGLGGGIVTNIISSDTVAGVSGSNTHVTARGQGNGITVKENDLASNPDLK